MFWDKIRGFCPALGGKGSEIVGLIAIRRGHNWGNIGFSEVVFGQH